jgi:hypothetical protein
MSQGDPAVVTAKLNFTFNPGYTGTYTVMNQINYYDGFYGQWENVGTLTIQTPPLTFTAPTLTLVAGGLVPSGLRLLPAQARYRAQRF